MLRLCSVWLLVSLWLLDSAPVHAQLAENLLIGNAKAIALGHAVTADPTGTDSIHFNPAGLAALRTPKGGWTFRLKTIGIADVSLRGSFKTPASDPYANQNVVINGCTNQCLLGGPDPVADTESTIENFQLYLPGRGVVKIDTPAVAPGFGLAYQPEGESNWVFATGMFIPFALGWHRSRDDPGVYAAREMAMGRIIPFAPSVAYQINDQWSVGGAFLVNAMGMQMGLDIRLPNLMLGVASTLIEGACDTFRAGSGLCNDFEGIDPYERLVSNDMELVAKELAYSFNLGVLWQPEPWFSWGLVYRHSTVHHLEGDYRLQMAPQFAQLFSSLYSLSGGASHELLGLPQGISEAQTGRASLTLKFPVHVATGIKLLLTPKWQLNLDYKWSAYGDWDEWLIKFEDPNDLTGLLNRVFPSTPTNTVPLKRGFQDTSNWSFGVVYHHNDRWQYRLGYEYRPDVAQQATKNIMLPIGDTEVFGLGFEYRVDRSSTIDFAIALVQSHSAIDANESPYTSTNPADVFSVYSGLDVETNLQLQFVQMNWTKQF